MEENNKVIVFEKKEIVLVLIFMVVLIISSFTLGIRLGKKLSLAEDGIKESDVKSLELKSNIEEDADAASASTATDEELRSKLMDQSKTSLTENLDEFKGEDKQIPATTNQSVNPLEATTTSSDEVSSTAAGKVTIQLGSYNTMDEAKQFAEGFTVRGYSPIINEVEIQGKGNWYRVSLGIFNSVEEAKTYIRTEQSLFTGMNYIISPIR